MTLTGTWTLMRFILRRDRVRLPVWILGIVFAFWVSAVSVIDLYPTRDDLDRAARTAEDNAALIALQAPAYGLDTVGGQVVFNIGSFGYVIVALMGMFLVGRHTRADEENGRTELLRATVLGRNAPVTAALAVVAAANVVAAALITLAMIGAGLPAGGSLLYGLATGGFGLLFAAVMAVAAQVTEHNRTALGLTGVVLGASYVVRAVGDVGDGALSWASPMGWAQYTKPYAGDHWWPLVLLLGAAVASTVCAYGLLALRDLGGGLVPPRPGPPRASPLLGRPAGLALRLQRASVVGWAAGLAFTGVAYGSVGQDIGDLIGDNEAVEDILAQAGGASLTDSFFASSVLMLALITGGFAISSVLRLRSEETGGRAEPLLATALSRQRWGWSHVLIALGGSVVVMTLAGLGMGVTFGIAASDAGQVGRLLGAAIGFVPALWVLIGVAFALFGVAPRFTSAAWGVFVLCFVIGLLGQLLGLPQWVMDISPFEHVPQMPVEGFAVGPTVLLLAVAAGLLTIGTVAFGRRDAGY
jgi:ABC-2 type transport system permease protein